MKDRKSMSKLCLVGLGQKKDETYPAGGTFWCTPCDEGCLPLGLGIYPT